MSDSLETRFIAEPIQAHFDTPPPIEKKPGCPDGFTWREEAHRITAMLSEWHDFTRRGRMARNMRPSNQRKAAISGSWGVGRDFYRVETGGGRVFDIYYDRAPKNIDERGGQWFLYREIITPPEDVPPDDASPEESQPESQPEPTPDDTA